MGLSESKLEQSEQSAGSLEKIPVKITLKQHNNIKLLIPYKQLEMIKLLQANYNYEVKGTLYFGHDNKFKSFEIRTDEDELYSTGASDWKISFHTHPDKTAQKYGIRYYSPPSVDDVMEIYDQSSKYLPDSISPEAGEISIIFTSEGIYVLQVNRELFKSLNLDNLSEKDQESMLQDKFNNYITDYIKDRIKVIYQATNPTIKPNYEDPLITMEQLSSMIKALSESVSKQFGFMMFFYDWDEIKNNEALTLSSNTYFTKKLID